MGLRPVPALCNELRSLHVPGTPLVLPNAWDVASARAVVAAGFPVVATTSGGVAASLGYEDHEHALAEEMLAAAARIARGVDVPVTVDAEAGYRMEAAALVERLQRASAAGCNLEDTDHATGTLRDPAAQAARLRAVRDAAASSNYALVINARIDVFLGPIRSGSNEPQRNLVGDALERAHAYVEAGVDCVFPIALWESDALEKFVDGARAPVNVLHTPRSPSIAVLAGAGVARVSYGSSLQRDSIEQLGSALRSIAAEGPGG